MPILSIIKSAPTDHGAHEIEHWDKIKDSSSYRKTIIVKVNNCQTLNVSVVVILVREKVKHNNFR